MSGLAAVRTVVVVDLARYSEISRKLEVTHGLGASAFRLDEQIKNILRQALEVVRVDPEDILLKSTGDGAILSFEDPMTAIRFACAVHAAGARLNDRVQQSWAQRHFRIGIATGYVSITDGDMAGLSIAYAARLSAAARTGDIVIDANTWDGLPFDEKILYGNVEMIRGKAHDPEIVGRRRQVVPSAIWDREPASVSDKSQARILRHENIEPLFTQSLSIENIKGIKRARIEFTKDSSSATGWYVLAGGNGSGKSTLLRSLAAASIGKASSRLLDDTWVRNSCSFGTVDVSYIHPRENADSVLASHLKFQRSGPETFSMTEEERKVLDKSFVAGYGPFKRLAGESGHARNLAENSARSRVLRFSSRKQPCGKFAIGSLRCRTIPIE